MIRATGDPQRLRKNVQHGLKSGPEKQRAPSHNCTQRLLFCSFQAAGVCVRESVCMRSHVSVWVLVGACGCASVHVRVFVCVCACVVDHCGCGH